MARTIHQILQELHSMSDKSELLSKYTIIKQELFDLINSENDYSFNKNYYVNHVGREFIKKAKILNAEELIKDEYDSGGRPLGFNFIFENITPTPTPSNSAIPITPTTSVTVTPTATISPSGVAPTVTPTASVTVTPTATISPSGVAPTVTPTASLTITPTASISPSGIAPSVTPTASLTITPTASISSSGIAPSVTPSITVTQTPTSSSQVAASPSVTPSLTPTVTPSNTVTPSLTLSSKPAPISQPDGDIVYQINNDSGDTEFDSLEYTNIIQDAVNHWDRVIVGQPLSDWKLEANITFDSLGEGTLGSASISTAMTTEGNLKFGEFFPNSGNMTLNTFYLSDMKNNVGNAGKSELYYVVKHEIGHLLGLGSFILRANSTIDGEPVVTYSEDGVDKYYYTGQHAFQAYKDYFEPLGYNVSEFSGIPIEDDGGAGTANSHPEEGELGTNGSISSNDRIIGGVFHPGLEHELMAGWSENGNYNPMSKISIGFLHDMGFNVDYNEADPYNPENPLFGVVSVTPTPTQTHTPTPTPSITPPFIPSNDINLANWWDSNNIDSLGIEGGSVLTWNNQVTNGKSLICPDGNPSPTLVFDTVNNVSVVRIDSITDRLAAGLVGTAETVFQYPSDTFAIIIATKITESPLASNDCLWFSSMNTYQYRAGETDQWQPQIGNSYSAANNTGTATNKLDGNMQIHTLIFDAANQIIKVNINQTNVIPNMSYPIANHFNSSLNRSIFLYSNAGQNATMAGDLGDVIMTTDINSSNLALHEQYLANKFGITL